ncbi:hypothetical protein BegalDRAFT_0927 [Beggiatoa alba B18LD]|uniref:Uncharacterized protein n=1 Tax=Beggiatoa alba B18LD TaxID=395493 RepID=I3CDZ2_9GAMM|nr:hypothetical protein [Beggiatoa alba]EIJ41835.1 hypothetical protein BegalDRAFT_0927 [Beggiatoa alba B18LD]
MSNNEPKNVNEEMIRQTFKFMQADTPQSLMEKALKAQITGQYGHQEKPEEAEKGETDIKSDEKK